MTRPIQALIHPSALVNNLLVARQAAPASKILAVIKANAYGHGLLRVAKALEECDGFAVLSLEEAVRLREAGFAQPILLLEGVFAEGEMAVVTEHRLSLVVHTQAQIEWLRHAWSPLRIDVFLKVNTGMHRLGFAPPELPRVLAALQACPILGRVTLMTHFASADEGAGVAGQLALFQNLNQDYGLPASLANSAALLRYPETHGAWVRPGIMLYGASPFSDVSAADLGLEPAMSLDSALIAVQQVQAGARVGYGGVFTADTDMRIGVVACGYADGYPRHAPSGTPILVDGVRTRTLGRVSMDMLMVDLTPIAQAGIGTPVRLWGDGLPVEEVARAAGTISYELLCARAGRVPLIEV
jgi:alanine racemase